MNMYKMISSLNTGLTDIIRTLNGDSDSIESAARKEIRDIKDSKETIGSKEITETKLEMNYAKWSASKAITADPFDLSQKNLQEAIIWSEILGKPMCKRRKSR